MNLSELNTLLSLLPAYAEFDLGLDGGKILHFMTRDMPRSDRRLTCISTGTEWFLPLNSALAISGLLNLTVSGTVIYVPQKVSA